MLLCSILATVVIIIGYYFKVTLIFAALLFVFLFVLLLNKGIKIYAFVFIVLILIILNYVSNLGYIKDIEKFDGKHCYCQMIVKKIEYEKDGFYIAKAKVTKCNLLRKGTNVSLSYRKSGIRSGDIINCNIKIMKIKEEIRLNSYSNDIVTGAFAETLVKDTYTQDTVLKYVENIKQYIKDTFLSNLKFSNAATLNALTTGDKIFFTNDFAENVKRSGVSHVMVVSGLHLSIIIGLFTFVVKKYFYNKYLLFIVQTATSLSLCYLCGFTMSILRASVMFFISAIGVILNRRPTPVNSLGAAISIIFIFSPFAIFNLSFQLSVLSTLGIVAIAVPTIDYLSKFDIFSNFIVKVTLANFVISFFATLFVTPIIIYYFGFISLFGILTTFLISFPVTLVLYLAVIGLFFPFLSNFLFSVCDVLLNYINSVINNLGSKPYSIIYLDKFWSYFSIILIIISFYILVACKKRASMIKLNLIKEKTEKERGRKLKWQ